MFERLNALDGGSPGEATPPPDVDLYYNLNGGTMANYNGGSAPGLYWTGSTITIPTTVPTKVGHSFAYWERTDNGAHYYPGNIFIISGDMALVARWEDTGEATPPPETEGYLFTLNMNGGTGQPGAVGEDTGYYAVGERIGSPSLPPVKEGYIFAGYRDTATANKVFEGDVDSYTFDMPERNVTVEVLWEDGETTPPPETEL
ncbi:MAG: InlB B-repeat-containing protein [Dysgonamonadaceae bacterium]|nr:InlB B-repeat-containing protein [Dysgonamonadaceae bacterium]